MLPRRSRLRASRDFRTVYSQGRSLANKHLVIYCVKSDLKDTRLGLSISRQYGGAVERNKAKRRLSELFRKHGGLVQGTYDIVIIARPDAAKLSYQNMEKAFVDIMRKATSNRRDR